MNMENQKKQQAGKYDIDSLIKLNYSYDQEHRVTQFDVDKANGYVTLIESTRSADTPKAGDILRYTDKHGSYYPEAHIEYTCEGICNICERPYVPFISPNRTMGIQCSTSGGAWRDLKAGELKYIGKQEKRFCDWGHCGSCGNGAIHFTAEVSVWEYVNPLPLYEGFTTEKWRRLYINRFDEKEPTAYDRQLYEGDGVAFRTEEEFTKFIETYKGKVFKGHWPNQFVVWCYREEQKQVSQQEYYNLDLPLIYIYCNGERPAKVAYDDDNKIAITHFVMPNCLLSENR